MVNKQLHHRGSPFKLGELREMLRSRDYGRGLIDTAIQRASAIPRPEALKRVVREKGDLRPVFAVTYDPLLPSITHIIRKHNWVMIANDPRLAEVFPTAPWWPTSVLLTSKNS